MDDIKRPDTKTVVKDSPPAKPASSDPPFVEPEAVAAKEDAQEPAKSIKQVKKPTKPKRRFWPDIKSWSKKKRWVVAILAFLLVAGAAYWFLIRSESAVWQSDGPPAEATIPVKTHEPSRLSGVDIPIETNKRIVTGVMIENSLDARPQAGLIDAGVVFEAIAEGGITRFLALFLEGQPGYLGPVRSARPYYIDWLSGFDAAYVHAGGSGEALSLIKALGIKDIEHGVNGSAFQRVSSRYAPHNLYTSMSNLDAVKEKRGYTTSDFTPIARKEEAPIAVPTAKTVNINVSSGNYAVRYEYDATANAYKRFLAGNPHTDEKSGTQLTPKVVVAMVVPYSIHADRVHSQYTTLGSGKAYIFQDGSVQEVTWHKTDRKSQITFTDSAGAAVSLNPGQTWFTVVATADRVTYTP